MNITCLITDKILQQKHKYFQQEYTSWIVEVMYQKNWYKYNSLRRLI